MWENWEMGPEVVLVIVVMFSANFDALEQVIQTAQESALEYVFGTYGTEPWVQVVSRFSTHIVLLLNR